MPFKNWKNEKWVFITKHKETKQVKYFCIGFFETYWQTQFKQCLWIESLQILTPRFLKRSFDLSYHWMITSFVVFAIFWVLMCECLVTGGFTLITLIITKYLTDVTNKVAKFLWYCSPLKSGKLSSDFFFVEFEKVGRKVETWFELIFFTLCNKNKMTGSFSFENQNNDVWEWFPLNCFLVIKYLWFKLFNDIGQNLD